MTIDYIILKKTIITQCHYVVYCCSKKYQQVYDALYVKHIIFNINFKYVYKIVCPISIVNL